MKRTSALILLIFISYLSDWSASFSCTGVIARTSKGVLIGSKEDYNSMYKDIIVRIRPAQAGKSSYLATGFERHNYFMMALNDQGLFLDMFVLPSVFQWMSDPNKMDYNASIEQKIMEECANVEQAIALLKSTIIHEWEIIPIKYFSLIAREIQPSSAGRMAKSKPSKSKGIFKW